MTDNKWLNSSWGHSSVIEDMPSVSGGLTFHPVPDKEVINNFQLNKVRLKKEKLELEVIYF